MESIFVYGTLKKGEGNYSLLKTSIQMGEAETVDRFCMFDLGRFPIVTEDEISPIHGEVYRVENDVLEDVDSLESRLYDRILIPVKLKDSGVIDAWMYVSRDDITDGTLISEGVWDRTA